MSTHFIRTTFIVMMALSIWSATSRAADVDVYILTGQSNSLGTTNLEAPFNPPADGNDALLSLFWSNVSTSSSDPNNINVIGDSAGAITTLQTQQGEGASPAFWGPEFGFARTLAGEGHTDVLVIKASRGGGGNTSWLPTTGHMYNHLLAQVDTALTELTNNGDTFEVKGLMYLQGESNSGAEAAASSARLQQLIDGVRTHVNTNHANAAATMRTAVGEIAVSQSNADRRTTTVQQKALAAGDADIFFVPTSDLSLKSDNLHYGRASKLTIGQRFANAFLGNTIVPATPYVAKYSADTGAPGAIQSPYDNGWTELGAGAGITLEGATDGGTRAWRVNDNGGSNPGYRHILTPEDFQAMYQNGWKMTVNAKVESGGGLALWSFTGDNDPGWGDPAGAMNGVQLNRVNGDELEVVLWLNGQTFNLGAGSADAFHKIELVGAAESESFDLIIDGQVVAAGLISNGATVAGFENIATFNSGSSGGTGRSVLWNDFEIIALPEPSSLMLLGVGGALALRRSHSRE